MKSEKFNQLPRCIYCQITEYLDTSGHPNELLTPHFSNRYSFHSFRITYIKGKETNKQKSTLEWKGQSIPGSSIPSKKKHKAIPAVVLQHY